MRSDDDSVLWQLLRRIKADEVDDALIRELGMLSPEQRETLATMLLEKPDGKSRNAGV